MKSTFAGIGIDIETVEDFGVVPNVSFTDLFKTPWT